ncbi:MAG: hypothetical protein HKN68_05310 [Saprospiraceae bacterium]|nr:hypothetical protein [Saprospiraceae bacterium]
MKKLFTMLVSILLISIPLTNKKDIPISDTGCNINFHALYILGIHMGGLDYASYNDYKTSHTDAIIGYAITAADATKCVSSARLKELKASMAGSERSGSFQGRIKEISAEYNREIENNCVCLECNTVVKDPHNRNWFWPVEDTHVWYANNIYQINERGYTQEVFEGSMTWGFIYYVKDPQGRWLRIDGNTVYYVDWNIFKSMYSHESKEDLPNDANHSHRDTWKNNVDGRKIVLTHLEAVTQWEFPVPSTHALFGKTYDDLKNYGYQVVLFTGSPTWGFSNYFKDNQNNYFRVTGNQVFSVNWDNFKSMYTYVKRVQVNKRGVTYQDVWRHNKTGHELVFNYVE